MSKRELSSLSGIVDVEGSRRKRRRDGLPSAFSDVDTLMSEPEAEASWQSEGNGVKEVQSVKEQGLELWLTMKDAKSKDGRLLSLVFLTKPPKKVYPDYYQIIKSPIALDDIKKRLDTDAYPSMQAVRADFELLFNNALQYNMKDSVIWKDAKDMLKLVHKTYDKLVPTNETEDISDDDDKKGKSKAPNLSRLIKSRLQKLVEKTDKDGRFLSTEFMELPNKKLWAIYYKQIKKPQCLENIFRRIKRKEYHTTAAFAADVELVFSNAMSFNQDHTPIWEDALALRDYFRQLMSDLPPPHNLPEYPSKITNKIKIKPPAAQASTPLEAANSKPDNTTSTLRLRVPAASAVKTSKPAPTPVIETKLPSTAVAVPSATTSTTSITLNSPAAPQPRPPLQHPVPPATQPSAKTSQSGSTAQPTFAYSHYSHPYQPPQHTPGPSATPAIPAKAAPALSSSPAPVPINPSRQIKYVKVKIQPQGRLFWLDYREGVKTWVLRLASGESEIDVDDLVFLADEEEEGSSDDEEDDFKQEDENDVDTDGPTSSAKNGRTRKGRSSTRRSQKTTPTNMRTTRSAAAVAKNKVLEKKKEEKIEEVQLKLNGTVVNEKQEATRQWNINLSAGSNTLEVGEKGGLMWKVYIERLAD